MKRKRKLTESEVEMARMLLGKIRDIEKELKRVHDHLSELQQICTHEGWETNFPEPCAHCGTRVL